MKQTVNIVNGTALQSKSLLIIASALILLFIHCQATFAKDDANDKSLKSYKLPSNLKQHLQDKYKDKDNKDQITEISSNLQETPQGPRGKLHLMGHIKPKNVEATSGDKHARARAISIAFLKEEAQLLGLPDFSELREIKIKTVTGHDGEYTDVYYERYIGDVLFEGGKIHIGVGPDESISTFMASLLPVPSETYQAVTHKTITEEDARRIVSRDVKAHGGDPTTMKTLSITKFASTIAPYVFWNVDVTIMNRIGRWEYLIDAFTGDILRKKDKIKVE